MKGELDRWRLFIPLRIETLTNIPGNRNRQSNRREKLYSRAASASPNTT